MQLRMKHSAGSVRTREDMSAEGMDRPETDLMMEIESLRLRVAELENAETALQKDGRQLADIINFLPDATLVIDRGGRVIAWNLAMENMTRIKAEHMLGKGGYEYALPFYGEKRPILIDLALHYDESLRGSYTDLKKQGEILSGEAYTPNLKANYSPHIYATASVLRGSGGEITGAIECFRDNTERKELEEKLIRSEKKYRDLVDNFPIGVYQTDITGTLNFANKAFADIFEYGSAEEMFSIDVAKLYRDEEDRKRIVRTLIREGRVNQHETVALTKKGVPKQILISAVLDGSLITGTVMDITARKRVLEDNAKLQAQLLRAQKMQAVGTLAGGIAHDFNNILMGIQGNTDLMLYHLPPNDPRYLRLRNIEDLVESGSNLTRQLLGFARGGKYEVQPTDINDIIEKSISIFSRTNKGIEISKRYVDPVWIVEADRGQIEQVFLNIFINAGQAMPGGGNLRVETRNVLNPENDKGSFIIAPGKYVGISVEDTGIGMDEKIIDRIFDPFFTTKGPGRGTGLGLASAYGIIKNHGGYILARSEPGRGSTFTIYLPAWEGEVCPKDACGDNSLSSGKETVLVVDDERTIAVLTKEMLESLGYRVIVAGGGREAVSAYAGRTGKIDLVILDMVMPGMSGEKTFEALQRIDTKVKVMLASGFSMDDRTQHLMESGCLGFIQKPFRMSELSNKVREFLDIDNE